jgi:hypothetical protein
LNLFAYQRLVRHAAVGATARHVLLTLTTWASGPGPGWEVWPPNDDLADACALSPKTLKRALKELSDAGWLARSRTIARRSLCLTVGQSQNDPNVGVKSSPSKGSNLPQREGQNDTIEGVKMTPTLGSNIPLRWGHFDPPINREEETMQETTLWTTEETRERKTSLSDSPARGGAGAREVAQAWDEARAAFVARNGGRS